MFLNTMYRTWVGVDEPAREHESIRRAQRQGDGEVLDLTTQDIDRGTERSDVKNYGDVKSTFFYKKDARVAWPFRCRGRGGLSTPAWSSMPRRLPVQSSATTHRCQRHGARRQRARSSSGRLRPAKRHARGEEANGVVGLNGGWSEEGARRHGS
jgi:hypothetical protein